MEEVRDQRMQLDNTPKREALLLGWSPLDQSGRSDDVPGSEGKVICAQNAGTLLPSSACTHWLPVAASSCFPVSV